MAKDRCALAHELAKIFGWRLLFHKKDQRLLRFQHENGDIIDVWYSKRNVVARSVDPAKYGKKMIYVHHVLDDQLEEMFDQFLFKPEKFLPKMERSQ